MAEVDDNFLPELAEFISTNGLHRIVALEILDNPLPEVMTEIVLGDHGTIMVDLELFEWVQFVRSNWLGFHCPERRATCL